MKRILSKKTIILTIFTLSGTIFVYTAHRALAATQINISNSTGKNEIKVDKNSNTIVNQENKSTTRNYVEVNGKVYVNETNTSSDPQNSKIEVNVQNDKGVVKYSVNGDEKTIEITPDEQKEKQKTEDKKPEDQNSNKPKEKTESFIEVLRKRLDHFFAKLSGLFS